VAEFRSLAETMKMSCGERDGNNSRLGSMLNLDATSDLKLRVPAKEGVQDERVGAIIDLPSPCLISIYGGAPSQIAGQNRFGLRCLPERILLTG